MTTVDARAEFTTGLRELADWLDEHPEVPLPYLGYGGGITDRPTFDIYLVRGDQRADLAAIARAMGAARKVPDDDRMKLVRTFAGIAVVASADRDEVCDRVVVGTREVVEEVPDPEALAAVPTVTVTKVVEDVRWECRPLLDDARVGVS